MKNMLYVMSMFIVLITFSACGQSHYTGVAKECYNPCMIDDIEPGDGAFIKVADGLYLKKVDGQKVEAPEEVGMGSILEGNLLDSVVLKEGKHTISFQKEDVISYSCFEIGAFFYKKGSEYLINYTETDSGRLYYWIEDMKTSEVILGQKPTKEILDNPPI